MERRLIRPNNLSPNTYADVVGLIPSIAHEQLSSSSQGHIDAQSSLSYLSLPHGKIILYNPSLCTLSEELHPPTQLQTLQLSEIHENPLSQHLMTLVSTPSSHNGNRNPLLAFYACLPNGILNVWNAVLLSTRTRTSTRNTRSRIKAPEEILRIPLHENEGIQKIISLSHTSTSRVGVGVLVYTDQHRIARISPNTKRGCLSLVWIENWNTPPMGSEHRVTNVLKQLWNYPRTSEQTHIVQTHVLPKSPDTDISQQKGLTRNTRSKNPRKILKRDIPTIYLTLTDHFEAHFWKIPEEKSNAHSIKAQCLSSEQLYDSIRTKLQEEEGAKEEIQIRFLDSTMEKDASQDRSLFIVAIRASWNQQDRLYLASFVNVTPPNAETNSGSKFLHLESLHWLSRYPTDVISNMECKGIHLACVTNSYVIYSIWQSPSGVTVTSIPLSSSEHSSRVQDLDLPSNIISGVLGCGTTSTMDGILIVSDSGCVIQARIKISSSSIGITTQSIAGIDDEATNSTLFQHLLQCFTTNTRDYKTNVPPSLMHAPSVSLNKVVMDTSLYLFQNESSSTETPLKEEWEERLERHKEFINFLHHVGIYKRLTSDTMHGLADMGEKICACGALMTTLDSMKRDLKRIYPKLSDKISLHGIQLINILRELQQELFPKDHLYSQHEQTHLIYMGSILYTVYSSALEYRTKFADILYDVRDRMGGECLFVPWTSQDSSRNLLMHHLLSWEKCMTEDPKNEIDLLAIILLEGFQAKSEAQAIAYHDAKRVAISILHRFSGEDMALEQSVKHAYLEAILEICDKRATKKYREMHSITSNTENDKDMEQDRYSLSNLLQRDKSDPLHQAVDISSGLSFSKYVLHWYEEKKDYERVLELGKYCPEDLKSILSKNEDLQGLYWMENIRGSDWGGACASLMTLLDQKKSQTSIVTESISLEDKALFLSFAKLTSELELRTNAGNSERDIKYNAIDDELLLVQCQEILFENDPDSFLGGMQLPLSTQQLLDFSLKQISNETLSCNQKVKAALTGLAISETKSNNKDHHYRASKIWLETITCEIETVWSDLLDQMHILTEEDLKKRMCDSLFYMVHKQYHVSKSAFFGSTSNKGIEMNSTRSNAYLSFSKNQAVREKILLEFQDNENLKSLLKSTARLSLRTI